MGKKGRAGKEAAFTPARGATGMGRSAAERKKTLEGRLTRTGGKKKKKQPPPGKKKAKAGIAAKKTAGRKTAARPRKKKPGGRP